MPYKRFPIEGYSKIRHGFLVEMLEKKGWTYEQAAEQLGISASSFRDLINMRKVPKRPSEWFIDHIEEFTGMTMEELWPPKVFTKEFLSSPRDFSQIHKVPVEVLAAFSIITLPPPTPFEKFERTELAEIVRAAIEKLPQDQAIAIRMHHLEGATLEDIAGVLKVTKSRVGQIIKAGLLNLRRPVERNHRLRMVVMERLSA